MVAFQAVDPGSIPGRRMIFFLCIPQNAANLPVGITVDSSLSRKLPFYFSNRINEPRHVISNNVTFWHVESDEPLRPPNFELRNSKWCPVSS